MSFVRILALAAFAASASAFCTSPSSCVLRSSSSAISRPTGALAFRAARAPMNGLRMQSEDDKAKASGIALATAGLILSKFSLLVAVLAGGAAVYAAKLPKEGDEGLSDTARQVSLLVGAYSLKLADFVKEKDAEGGYSQKLLGSVKEAIEQAKSSIKQG